MQSNFQDGCEKIVAALTARGVTPSSNSIDDIVIAINNIKTSHTLRITTFKDGYNAVAQANVLIDGKSVWSWNTGYATGSASGDSGNITI